GLAESAVKHFKRGLRKLQARYGDDWPRYFYDLLFAHRICVRGATLFSAFHMVYGRHQILPVERLFAQRYRTTLAATDEEVDDVTSRCLEVIVATQRLNALLRATHQAQISRAAAFNQDLLPDEARSYVVACLRRNPTCFDAPEEPWAKRDRSPAAIRPERAQEGDREHPPRLAAQRAAAAIQEVAVAEAVQPPAPAPAPAERPPPRRPSRQPRPSPQRGAQATAATSPSTGVDYSAIFNTAARGASAANTLQAAILRLLNSLAEQPFPCPDPIWGTRRQLTNELLATPDLQPSNRRASMGNIPVIDNLCQLISATSRADTGLAQHVCAFLQRFLATGARAGPPAGGPPPSPGGRGPPRDDSCAGGRGHSSPADQRDNGGGGRGGGRDRRSPPPDDGAKRRRLGDGEQDAEKPHRELRQRVRERAPSPPDRPTRSRRSLSPSPPRSDRSPSRRRGRSPTTQRPSRGRANPRSTSPSRRLPAGESRRQPPAKQPFIFNRSTPAGRRRSPISEGRHQAAMAALRNAVAEPRVFRRGKGAENTVVAYLGHNPQEHESRSIRPDTAAIGRTIYGHIKKSLDNGDYDPPAASPTRSCSPHAPPARSPSLQLLDIDRSPSPPRVGLAEQISKLPDVLQHLKDGTSPPATPGPPRPPKPNSLKEANEALLVSQLKKTSAATPVPAASAPPAADVIIERPAGATTLPPPPPPMWKAPTTPVALPWPKPQIADVAPAESSSPPRTSDGVPDAVRSPATHASAPATRLEAATPAPTSSEPLPGGAPVKIKFRGPASFSGVSSGAPVSVITAVTPASAGNHIPESEPERAPLAAPITVETKRERRKKERRPAVDPTTGEPLKRKKKKRAIEHSDAGAPQMKKKKTKKGKSDAKEAKTACAATPSPPPTRRSRQAQFNADIQAAAK
ncbi:hypothetical protein KFL_014240010, partial [Klebsormidium nitens]